MKPEQVGNGTASWLSPDTVTKFMLAVGVPSAALIFLLLVITGLISTPLMEGMRLIPRVIADHMRMQDIMEESVYLQRVDCQRKSTEGNRSECTFHRPPQP